MFLKYRELVIGLSKGDFISDVGNGFWMKVQADTIDQNRISIESYIHFR